MKDPEHVAQTLRKPAAVQGRSPTARRVRLIGLLLLVSRLVALVLSVVYVGNRALVAKDSLQAAQRQITSFKAALGQQGAPSTAAMYTKLQADTTKAAEQVDDPVWAALEHIPYVGPNLKAFRQTAELVNTLVHDGVGPLAQAANGIKFKSLRVATS